MLNKVFKRSRQLFRALFSKMEPSDYRFVEEHLNVTEKRLFYNMEPSIQKHCVNVAYSILISMSDSEESNSPFLIKAALLHDIGKSRGSIRLFDRVCFVMSIKLSPRFTLWMAQPRKNSWLPRIGQAFYVHCYHGEIGASLAEKAGLSVEMIYLIKNHHDRNLALGSGDLAALLNADELN